MYLQCHASTEETGNTSKIIFYALCVLYLLSVVVLVLDVLTFVVSSHELFFFFEKKKNALISGAVASTQLPILHLYYSTRGIWLLRFYRPKYPSTHKLTMPIILLYSSKSSKIYRCWIVWNSNIRVVIIPSILALAYLGSSIYSLIYSLILIYRL